LSLVLPIVLVALATAPVLDALRRKGVFVRPEFYLLVSLYLYGTGGYLTYLVLPPGAYLFLLPASSLSVTTSYLYAVSAILAVYVGGRLYDPGEPESRVHGVGNRTLVALALAVCVAALAANIYYFAQFGLFSGNFDRVLFIDAHGNDTGFRVPYTSLLLASLPILALHERRPASWLMLLAFALLHLPVGNRRFVLSAFIVLMVAKLLAGRKFGRRTLVVALAGVLVVGVVVGVVRGSGKGFSALSNIKVEGVFLALSEFSRPFISLVYYVENGYKSLYGTGLLQAIANIIPGVVSPFGEFLSPGRQFVQVVETLGVFPGRVSGYGFFPVTEALLNFGPAGIPVAFFLLALLIRRFSRFALLRDYALFVIPILCSAMFAFGRSSLSDLIATYSWTVVFGLVVHLAARLIVEVAERRRASRKSIPAQSEG
jgi:hypothetical protein